ncbi:hypothetical protein AgCh_009159 [Apium graveolens]
MKIKLEVLLKDLRLMIDNKELKMEMKLNYQIDDNKGGETIMTEANDGSEDGQSSETIVIPKFEMMSTGQLMLNPEDLSKALLNYKFFFKTFTQDSPDLRASHKLDVAQGPGLGLLGPKLKVQGSPIFLGRKP